MVHTGQIAAAAGGLHLDSENDPADSRPRPGRPSLRSTSIGSFRAGSPLPTLQSTGRSLLRRMSTHYHYQTFPTPPPKTPGLQRHGSSSSMSDAGADKHRSTPLPVKQLALLAVLSLAEQTALNSISPYLPEMVKSFPGVDEGKVGVYVGTLASAFALAQLTTNLAWGCLSDVIGRKPVMLLGTSLLCLCFVLFGFCTRYAHIVTVHVAMGLLNGNAAVVPTCLGELTDRSNQSKAFTWLPVVYSLGSITGPALGGLLVGTVAADKYPYLAPNILGASLLAVSVVVLALWFDETLEEQGDGFQWSEKLGWLFCCVKRTKKNLRRSLSSTWLRRQRDRAAEEAPDNETSEERRLLGPASAEGEDDPKSPSDVAVWHCVFNRTTITLLITYLFFQLSNISFGSLYPLFASEDPPTGRGLHPDVIGISLSVAGILTVLFQLFIFRSLKAKLGNLGSYRGSLLGFAVAMALMPWVGYADSNPPWGLGSSKSWLYVEMGAVLVIRNICAVGGLSSVMLLITNSAPTHAVLGTLNGIAQTLSALGRSFGPLIAGSLFSISIGVEPKGEALAWGLFGGIALAGWLGTWAIRGEGLESIDDGFEEAESHPDTEDA
ncbi:major facilitator superfamily transporter [Pseudomassariella vexata]|uniref:Major facilitator superfamily transporter n=1 Tax=Pseudomassariella vexata TaxID=1141098 RepID=A0A1Y2D8Y8_9PEZI|nr:major facilitator superfamily transporter [Pseudomassariella vexata]ORY55644.1 major facilitator superfamily transporter [Pseudomassariella vexata]